MDWRGKNKGLVRSHEDGDFDSKSDWDPVGLSNTETHTLKTDCVIQIHMGYRDDLLHTLPTRTRTFKVFHISRLDRWSSFRTSGTTTRGRASRSVHLSVRSTAPFYDSGDDHNGDGATGFRLDQRGCSNDVAGSRNLGGDICGCRSNIRG